LTGQGGEAMRPASNSIDEYLDALDDDQRLAL
jgi:hypothetical protein